MCAATQRGGVELELKIHGNALIHRSRNLALANVREGAHALLMDDDMLPEADCALKLLNDSVPVVSALCTTRTYPVRIAAKIYDEERDVFCPISAVKMNKLLAGRFAVGAACLLLDPATIAALLEYNLTARDWVDENRRTFERLHARSGMVELERARKEGLRRELWKNERYCRIFDYGVQDNELELGEDVSFSRKLIRLGIDSAIDTGAVVAHVGERPFGVWDIVEEQESSA